MPFNGSGSFAQLYNWISDAAAGLKISSKRMQEEAQDVANGLTQCLTRDGQSVPSADLPMNGFKHTNVAPGVADGDYATIAQLHATRDVLNLIFPIGSIIMWSGVVASIPANFHLCDGTNGTHNLSGRFVIGTHPGIPPGTPGGTSGSVVLAVAHLPPHAHPVFDPHHTHHVADPSHYHTFPGPSSVPIAVPGTALNLSGQPNSQAASATTPAITGIGLQGSQSGVSVGNTGAGQPFGIMPPFLALAYIMRVS